MTKIICDGCGKEIDEDTVWSEKKPWRGMVKGYAFEVKLQTMRLTLDPNDADVHCCRDCMAEMLNAVDWASDRKYV